MNRLRLLPLPTRVLLLAGLAVTAFCFLKVALPVDEVGSPLLGVLLRRDRNYYYTVQRDELVNRWALIWFFLMALQVAVRALFLRPKPTNFTQENA